MFSAIVRIGYPIFKDIAYPVDITNTGTSNTTVSIIGSNSIFTSSSTTVSPGDTETIYVTTDTENETLVLNDNDTTINLIIVTQIQPETEQFGDPSENEIFQLPENDEVTPTLENIHLLMSHGHYFTEDGQVKIWRPDTL